MSSPVRQVHGRLLRVLSSDATRGSLEGHAALAFKNGHRVTAFHPRDEWRPAPRALRLSARSDPRPAERMARLLSQSPWSADRDDDATVAVLPDGAGPPEPRLPWPRVYASFARWRDTGPATELHDRLREAVRRIRWRKISHCCVEGFECAKGARAAEESFQCGPAVALGPTGSVTRAGRAPSATAARATAGRSSARTDPRRVGFVHGIANR
ncbi:hypothetical protein ACWCPJ_09230 [Streptomyces collinus]